MTRLFVFWHCTVLLIFSFFPSKLAVISTLPTVSNDSLVAATQKLGNAFQALLSSGSSAASLSDFTDNLAASAIKLLENVPSEVVVNTVTVQTKSASENKQLPNPDDEGCTRDYSQMCPDKWVDLGDGSRCKAPDIYEGDCDKIEDMANSTPLSKQQFAASCKTAWPCKEKCDQDFSYECPQQWKENGDSVCVAATEYNGRCVREKSFVNFDDKMKEMWARECRVTWPCKKRDSYLGVDSCPIGWEPAGDNCVAPKSYVGPCDLSLPLVQMSDKKRRDLTTLCKLQWSVAPSLDINFSMACPSGWTVSTANPLECSAPAHYQGPCNRVQSFVGFTEKEKDLWARKCGSAWPQREDASHDYSAACPETWTLEKGLCVANFAYRGPCETRFSFINYTPVMKSAWSQICKAPWSLTSQGERKTSGAHMSPQLHSADQGPVAPRTGIILEANGTIYYPTRLVESTNNEPLPPDQSASAMVATGKHIDALERLEKVFNNSSSIRGALEESIEEMKNQGEVDSQFATSFLQTRNVPENVALFSNTEDTTKAVEDPMSSLLLHRSGDCKPDYSKCPDGWQQLDSTRCVAPETYISQQKTCMPVLNFKSMTFVNHFGQTFMDTQKLNAWARDCGVSFPCVTCTHDYITSQCPSGWSHLGYGSCMAPSSYDAVLREKCGSVVDFSTTGPEFRRSWAQSCGAEWPCFEQCERDYSDPCPAGFMKSKNGCTDVAFYGNGLCPSPLNFKDDQKSKQDIAAKCGVSWPCLSRCVQDFNSQYCPYGWVFNKRHSTCTAPFGYKPPIGCALTLKLSQLTAADLGDISLRCHAPWPCVDNCQPLWIHPCPKGWITKKQSAVTNCIPPKTYNGPCSQKAYSLDGYTFAQKQDFSFRCGVRWPCGANLSPEWQTPEVYVDTNWEMLRASRFSRA